MLIVFSTSVRNDYRGKCICLTLTYTGMIFNCKLRLPNFGKCLQAPSSLTVAETKPSLSCPPRSIWDALGCFSMSLITIWEARAFPVGPVPSLPAASRCCGCHGEFSVAPEASACATSQCCQQRLQSNGGHPKAGIERQASSA